MADYMKKKNKALRVARYLVEKGGGEAEVRYFDGRYHRNNLMFVKDGKPLSYDAEGRPLVHIGTAGEGTSAGVGLGLMKGVHGDGTPVNSALTGTYTVIKDDYERFVALHGLPEDQLAVRPYAEFKDSPEYRTICQELYTDMSPSGSPYAPQIAAPASCVQANPLPVRVWERQAIVDPTPAQRLRNKVDEALASSVLWTPSGYKEYPWEWSKFGDKVYFDFFEPGATPQIIEAKAFDLMGSGYGELVEYRSMYGHDAEYVLQVFLNSLPDDTDRLRWKQFTTEAALSKPLTGISIAPPLLLYVQYDDNNLPMYSTYRVERLRMDDLEVDCVLPKVAKDESEAWKYGGAVAQYVKWAVEEEEEDEDDEAGSYVSDVTASMEADVPISQNDGMAWDATPSQSDACMGMYSWGR